MVYDSEGSSLLYSYSFSDIISIEQKSFNIYHQFTILIRVFLSCFDVYLQLRKNKMLLFSFSCESEVNEWYKSIKDTQISYLNKYTNGKRIIGVEIDNTDISNKYLETVYFLCVLLCQFENFDAELCIILRRLSICNTQDELKSILFEIQRFQNEKPIEIVALQKPL